MGFAQPSSSSLARLAQATRRLSRRVLPHPRRSQRSLDLIHPTVELAPNYPRLRDTDALDGDGPCQPRSPAARPAGPSGRVRVVRAGAPGRMVISGRMADVCAELNRLAALPS